MKRLLRDNVGSNGNLDTDAVTRGILQLRNTPETDSKLSPAQILLGRTLRDSLPLRPPIPFCTTVFDPDSAVSWVWKDAWSAKEHALKTRLARQVEKLEVGSHALKPLDIGDIVRLQNQAGNHPTKWDKTGTVVQIGDNDQYIVMVDGSRRLTLRNRRYLRKKIRPTQSENPLPPAPLLTHLPATPALQSPATQRGKQQLQAPVAQSLQLPATQSPATPRFARLLPDPGPSSRAATLSIANHQVTLPARIVPGAGPASLPATPDASRWMSLPAHVKSDAGPASPPATPNRRVALPARVTPDAGLACRPTITELPSTSQDPAASVPATTPAVQLRRSTRERKQRVCYDPTMGGSTHPNAVSEAM